MGIVLFTPGSLAVQENVNVVNMTALCTVEVRASTAGNASEGASRAGGWVAVGTKLPCRVSPISAAERVRAEQTEEVARFRVTFARGVAIPLGARLRVVDKDWSLLLDPHGANGPRSFEVQRTYECSLWNEAGHPG